MRAFVAIFPPPEVQKSLLRAAQNTPLEGNIRWIRQENIHLTLKFLGDVDEGTLESVRAALGEVARRHDCFPLQTSTLGAFPSNEKARVLWAGVDKGAAELSALAADVEDVLGALGFGREKKSYKPHATLGRVRGRPAKLPDDLGVQAPEFTAWRLDLVQSVLGAGGANYNTVESYPLHRE